MAHSHARESIRQRVLAGDRSKAGEAVSQGVSGRFTRNDDERRGE